MRTLHRSENPDGWSLLEVLVAMALMSILAGTAVLAHQAARPMLDLNAAVRQVAMDLRLARMRAISDGFSRRIVFTAGGISYQKQLRGRNGYLDDGPPVALPRGTVVSGCTASGDAISFGPRGNAGSFGTVSIQNDRGDLRQVVVNIAGRVRVQ